MSDNFHFSQWNDPAWREKHKPANVPASPEPEITIPACHRCGSANLHPGGWVISKRWEEKRQNVHCHDCHTDTRLPFGVVLPAKVKIEIPVEPGPPRCSCGSLNLRPRGWTEDNRQKAHCLDCGKISRLRAAQSLPGRYNTNTEHIWELPDVAEEAAAMFLAARHAGCAFEEMKKLISVSDGERRQLDFLIAHGILIRERVEEAIRFREAVLRSFDKLVASHRNNRIPLAAGNILSETAFAGSTSDQREGKLVLPLT